ncbi:MAG: AraC family transcriptional regulator [Clostridiaceae bacterium]
MDRDLLAELIDKSEIILSPSGHGRHRKDTEVVRTLADYDFFYILSGSYALTINGREYAASPGDSYLLTPKSTFVLTANIDSEQLFYHFSVQYAGKMNLAGDFEDYRLSPAQSSLIKLFRECFEDCINGKTAAKAALKSVLKVILLEMVFTSEENLRKFTVSTQYSFNSRFLNVIKYIQANPCIPINNSFLAEMAGLNPCYFSRYFKKFAGISASDYIDNVKMNAAKQLLMDKKVSVKEAAIELGFSDQFVFSKKFKKHFSISPNEFKKMNI